jgi:hypothetical protein
MDIPSIDFISYTHFKVSLDYVTLGGCKLDLVRLGCVRLLWASKVRLGWVRLDQVKLGWIFRLR